VLLLSVAIWAYAGAITAAGLSVYRHQPWNWAEMAVSGLGPGLGWGFVWALQNAGLFPTRESRRLRDGKPNTIRAISTGTLPPDADPRRWRPWLEGDVRELHQVRRLVLALWIPGGALVATAGAFANDDAWGVWALAAALVAVALVEFRRLTGRIDTAGRLLDELVTR
jgi:hypothetical protein